MNFKARKQLTRTSRREWRENERHQATQEGRTAAMIHGVEFRLRGFFPSHPKVYAMIDERLHSEWERLEKLRDHCIVLLDTLASASDDAMRRGDIVTRARMNRAVAKTRGRNG